MSTGAHRACRPAGPPRCAMMAARSRPGGCTCDDGVCSSRVPAPGSHCWSPSPPSWPSAVALPLLALVRRRRGRRRPAPLPCSPRNPRACGRHGRQPGRSPTRPPPSSAAVSTQRSATACPRGSAERDLVRVGDRGRRRGEHRTGGPARRRPETSRPSPTSSPARGRRTPPRRTGTQPPCRRTPPHDSVSGSATSVPSAPRVVSDAPHRRDVARRRRRSRPGVAGRLGRRLRHGRRRGRPVRRAGCGRSRRRRAPPWRPGPMHARSPCRGVCVVAGRAASADSGASATATGAGRHRSARRGGRRPGSLAVDARSRSTSASRPRAPSSASPWRSRPSSRVVALGVLSTLLRDARSREDALFTARGATRAQLVRWTCLETLVVGAAGAVVGAVVGGRCSPVPVVSRGAGVRTVSVGVLTPAVAVAVAWPPSVVGAASADDVPRRPVERARGARWSWLTRRRRWRRRRSRPGGSSPVGVPVSRVRGHRWHHRSRSPPCPRCSACSRPRWSRSSLVGVAAGLAARAAVPRWRGVPARSLVVAAARPRTWRVDRLPVVVLVAMAVAAGWLAAGLAATTLGRRPSRPPPPLVGPAVRASRPTATTPWSDGRHASTAPTPDGSPGVTPSRRPVLTDRGHRGGRTRAPRRHAGRRGAAA